MSSETMWYYQFESERAGPVSEESIGGLIADGVILRETLVWREGMSNWQEAYLTELSRYFIIEAPKNGDGVQSGGWREYLSSRRNLPQKLRKWYLIFGFALCISVFFAGLGPVAWVAALASTFFCLLIMYHVWSFIPAQKRMLSPLYIVLLMIIPLFNMVWIFYCYYIASRKINAELRARGIEENKPNEYMALGYSISVILMTVLFVISVLTGAIMASLSMTLIVLIVFLQVFMMRSFIIAIVKLL